MLGTIRTHTRVEKQIAVNSAAGIHGMAICSVGLLLRDLFSGNHAAAT